jgi:hypothetical protein
MSPNVFLVLYNCLIISVVHTPPHTSKIVVNLFHTFIELYLKNNLRIKSTRYRSYDLEKISH